MNIREIINDMRALGVYALPLGYTNGKFRHPPEYKHLFATGGTDAQIEQLIQAGMTGGVAVFHAACNPDLRCIDVDEKNAPGVELYLTLLQIIDPYLFSKLVVEKTRSGGYHIYFLCKAVPKVKALASSPVGEEWIAIRSSASNCITYCAPSPGYQFIQGCFDDLQELTEREMQEVCDAAMQLDKYEGVKAAKGQQLPVLKAPAAINHIVTEFDRLAPLEWVQGFLHDNGWKTDGNVRRKLINEVIFEYVRYWRPGRDFNEPSSANLWLQRKRLSVFSSSTCLPSFDSGESFMHTASSLLYYYNDKDWAKVMMHITGVAEQRGIELPEEIPMAYSTISNNRAAWRVEVKGIIQWAVRQGYQWMPMSGRYACYYCVDHVCDFKV